MASIDEKRHTLAHLLAAAVLRLYPDAKRAIGPTIDNGFYFDFEFPTGKPSESDLPSIEKKMREILPSWTEIRGEKVSADKAREMFRDNSYKLELINEFADRGDTLTVYHSEASSSQIAASGYFDLCRGGHAENPAKEIAADSFRLDRLAGAYWRGDEKNPMLTRIYGLAFDAKKELDAYLAQREEAKKRDHRKLGRELDLFTFSELVGAGLPLFTPRGTILREEINNFSQALRLKRGFQKVWIPHITKKELYETSGHWAKFGDELFLVKSQETSDELVMKPMNCPHHQQIYASQMRSYRDLPIKYLETTTIYRDEKAGELLGLSRVRSITQDDSHIFCTPEQLDQIYAEVLEVVKEFYSAIRMPLAIRLSFRDPKTPEKYLGDEKLWERAQHILTKTADEAGLEFFEAEGEAAFYGPKIDFMATDSLGRQWQVATAQLDFVQPVRFEITYIDKDGSAKTPIMIHFAVAGSLERFLSVYIEHTGGNFPLWLSPVGAIVLPIGEKHQKYAKEIFEKLKSAGIRAELDDSGESLGKKIRSAKEMKIPYLLVIGDEEVNNGTATLESRDAGKIGALLIEKIIEKLCEEISARK
ncbi:MAG: threonine--tRNA ligase [Minisyncoccia bacterium]